jgi:regulator of cell morphogenesis and NO signaling
MDDGSGAGDDLDPVALSLSELCDHIVDTHHAYLRRELTGIASLLRKVVPTHGARHPELPRVAQTFGAFAAEMRTHLLKEEQILFPLIKQLEAGGRPPESLCGGVKNPIAVMEAEHDAAGKAMRLLRELTGNYTPPADACTTYRALLRALGELE